MKLKININVLKFFLKIIVFFIEAIKRLHISAQIDYSIWKFHKFLKFS